MKKADAIKDAQARGAFFSVPAVAERLWEIAVAHARRRGFEPGSLTFIEPSAGAGVFLDAAPEGERVLGFGIQPMDERVKQQDFLKLRRSQLPGGPLAVIGNFPFGRQGALSSAFINRSLILLGAEFVASVVPGVLAGYHGQRRVAKQIGVVGEPEFIDGSKAFVLPDGRKHVVGHCRHIIWERTGKRSKAQPDSHPDFRMVSRRPDVDGSRPPDGWGLFIHETQFNGTAQRPGEETEQPSGGFRGTFIYAEPDVIKRLAKIDWGAINRSGCSGKVHHLTKANIAAAYAARHGWGEASRSGHPDFRCVLAQPTLKGERWAGRAKTSRELVLKRDWCMAFASNRPAILLPEDAEKMLVQGAGFHLLIYDQTGSPDALVERMRRIDFEQMQDKIRHDGSAIAAICSRHLAAAYADIFGWGGPDRTERPPTSHPDIAVRQVMTNDKNARKASLAAIERRGWLVAYNRATRKTLGPDTATQVFDGLGGGWLLIYDRSGNPDRTLERVRALDWDAMRAACRVAGNAIGNINPRHVYETYEAAYGRPRAQEQGDLF